MPMKGKVACRKVAKSRGRKGEKVKKQKDSVNYNSEISKENYKQYVFDKMPKSSHWKNMFWAFVVGGTICTIGQALIEFYKIWFELQDASVLASATLVFIAALLTGFGVYDNIGRFAGAGSTIPITGFPTQWCRLRWNFVPKATSTALAQKCFRLQAP